MRRASGARIESITVDGLFGFLSYEIPAKSPQNLMILYGDNGSGKTTLLNLVFHALNSADSRGHRTFIAGVPFKRLAVDFADGHVVSVIRKSATDGPFTMRVDDRGTEIARHHFGVSPDGRVGDQENRTYFPLLGALSGLSLGLFLLPDNRRIQSSIYEDEESPRYRRVHSISERKQLMLQFPDEAREEPEAIDTAMRKALGRAVQWARSQALAATSQGENDTTKIYADILARIGGAKSRDLTRERNTPFAKLPGKVESLKRKSETLSRFGLVKPLDATDVLRTLESAPSNTTRSIISQVLSPYLSSLEARFSALDGLRDALASFSEIFSRFYNYKTLTFDVRTGVNITVQGKSSPLPIEVLSSGEKQLLLLFCNVLLARSQPSIFIIDEPELSLNVKWQRELISSLAACVKDCDVQFVFATHSIEVISRHKSSAVRLENTT